MASELKVAIRLAELSDINEIIKINRLCLPENYSFDFFYRILTEFGFACVVATVNNSIGGYVLTRIEKPIASYIGLDTPKGHIVSIAVLPQYRRLQIAAKMMKFTTQKLIEKGINEVFLEVRVSNQPAIQLYKKLSYKIKKEIKEYYRDGESAYYMKWGGDDSIDDYYDYDDEDTED